MATLSSGARQISLQSTITNLCLMAFCLSAAGSETVTLQTAELSESSGVAQVGDFFWSHNDSGDRPRLFVFAADGRLHGEITVTGARAVDWEDMCSFTRDGRQFVAVGDVGDNDAQRTAVQIYVIAIPDELLAAQSVAVSKIILPVAARYSVTYADGPVNCEALAYDPRTDAFVLATKELFRCRLFSVPLGTLEREQNVVAQWLGTWLLPMVTGGDISTDGSRMVLCTYGPGCVIGRSSQAGREHHWLSSGDDALLIFPLPARRQGEAICFGSDDQSLFLTSEFRPTPLLRIPVPEAPLTDRP